LSGEQNEWTGKIVVVVSAIDSSQMRHKILLIV
jgi:hypothetical protein